MWEDMGEGLGEEEEGEESVIRIYCKRIYFQYNEQMLAL